jgi:arsenite methyltransferase
VGNERGETQDRPEVSIADVMADQLRRPSGPLGPLVARRLNRRNCDLIAHTVDALDVGRGHRVLDLGFGGALSLRLLLGEVGHGGRVCGVEPSTEMVRRARRLLRYEVETGRLVVRIGTSDAIPFGDAEFDRVLTCQTVYFWPDVRAGLAELHRVVAPGGRVAVAMMPRHLQEQFGFAERGYNVLSHRDLAGWLRGSGFIRVRLCPPRVDGPPWVLVACKP